MFSEFSKNCAGRPLDSFETLLKYARNTRTTTGLKVTASLSRRSYETGVKITAKQMALLNIHSPKALAQWNYSLFPRQHSA